MLPPNVIRVRTHKFCHPEPAAGLASECGLTKVSDGPRSKKNQQGPGDPARRPDGRWTHVQSEPAVGASNRIKPLAPPARFPCDQGRRDRRGGAGT